MGFIALPQAPRSQVPALQKKLLKSRKTQLLPWIAAALVMLKEERVLLGHLLLRQGCAGMLPCLPQQPPSHPSPHTLGLDKVQRKPFLLGKKKKKRIKPNMWLHQNQNTSPNPALMRLTSLIRGLTWCRCGL